MLRYVFGIFRNKCDGGDEDWVEYLRRANRKIEEISTEPELQDWVELQRRRKWQLAGKVARATDNRWSHLVLDWRPHFGHGRSPGHPATRWTDQLEGFAGGTWMAIAADPEHWEYLENGFVTYDRQC